VKNTARAPQRKDIQFYFAICWKISATELKRFCPLFLIDFIEEDHDGFKGLFKT
jgi:hypothetical protein